MLGYDWPGNCRELLNFVERLSVLWPGEELTLAKIPAALLPRKRGASAPSTEEQRAVLDMWQWDEEVAATPADPASSGSLEWTAAVEVPKVPGGAGGKMSAIDLKQLLADYEASWVREAMRVSAGNITHAADLLGLPRTTFIERLRKYEPSVFRQ
jgi:sigma-54 specific flagellar transcriptional regulator A